jgi:lipopolysaccharide export system protein LptA
VTGHGPFGTLRADRFEVDHKKQLLHLTGNVHMSFSTLRTK